MPFNAFYGEFMFSPMGLDLSGNTCSHNCAYCFANLNEPLRRSGFASEINFIKTAKDESSYAKILFNAGVPICFSNKSDPLSESNVAQTFGLWALLKDKPNGIFWQTKSGKRWKDFVSAIAGRPNQAVYITITSTLDSISERLEPNSPRCRERVALAEALINAGIPVFIGLNPLHPKWFPEDELFRFVHDMRDLGVSGFLIRAPYILQSWIKNGRFNERRRAGMCGVEPESLIDDVNEAGFYCYSFANGMADDGFIIDYNDIHGAKFAKLWQGALGEMAFPSFHTFYALAKGAQPGTEFTFEDFYRALVPAEKTKLNELFNREFSQTLDTYTFNISRNAYLRNRKMRNLHKFVDVMRGFFSSREIITAPRRYYFLRYDAEKNIYIRKSEEEIQKDEETLLLTKEQKKGRKAQ